jgi:hypothetical protein
LLWGEPKAIYQYDFAELDGDELGYLIAKVVEIKRQP